MKSFGTRLTLIREARGLTQSELALAVGITENRLRQIENGLAKPRISEIVNACTFLNVKADYLVGLIDEPTPRLSLEKI